MTQTSMALALSAFSFLLTVIWGQPLLRILKMLNIGEKIRIDGPKSHISKLGTPTMGGVLILFPVALLTILFNAVKVLGVSVFGNSVLVPLIVLIAFALIGSVDDWVSLRGIRSGDGLSARVKLILQLIVALGTVIVLRYYLEVPFMYLPGIDFDIKIGWFYFPIAVIAIAGYSNAINFTDGLDGLAGLISATAFAAYGVIALIQGQIFLARFCFIVVGSLFGFLWFNVHPAELFMGDTGSLALGATLAVVALFAKGKTKITNIANLRVKETDRIKALAAELRKIGAFVEEKEDSLTIQPNILNGAEIETYNDHRMAMSFAVAGLMIKGIKIKNPACVNKSFPGFFNELKRLY